MRLLLFTVLSACFLTAFPACADETANTAAVGMNNPLFRKAFERCMDESAALAEREKLGEPDLSMVSGCLMDKGIDIQLTGGERRPQAIRMGAGRQDATAAAKVMAYKIKDPGDLEKKLQGVDSSAEAISPVPEPESMPSVKKEPEKQEPQSQERPAPSGLLYVPSKKSGGGPKPIFLDR